MTDENSVSGSTWSNDMDGSQSTGKINRIIRRLSNKVTPPRLLSLRSRRGLTQPQAIDLEAASAEHENRDKIEAATVRYTDGQSVDVSETVERSRSSVREDSLRKREKIAELRRRRQQRNSVVVAGTATEDGLGNTTPSRVTSNAARHLTSLFRQPPRQAAGNSSLEPNPVEQPDGVSSMPVPVEQPEGKRFMTMVTPAEEGFFNSPELNLLLHQVDLDPLIEPAVARPEPITPEDAILAREMDRRAGKGQTRGLGAKNMRRANSHNGYLSAGDLANKGEADFTINIPSTSLSPLVPFGGWPRILSARLRGRARTVAQISEKKNGSVVGTGHAVSGKRIASVAEDEPSDEDLADILGQLEKEMETNAKLKRDLAMVGSTADQLVKLLNTSINSGRAGNVIR
ncbi:hypothetical protein LPJ64_000031 [Coemansia asiatica]|uniref:Uncharacterized protein n=1 Tax=Coemansia asiatica TaxID=1052880 RepID=A0A9W7XSM2_9FUNG|nr:hypothetical protein LPJ64_000031 [Coemansia asiatica]